MDAPSLKNQAEALAIGLELGTTSVEEAVRWADAIIDAEDEPPWAVCEVAMMARKHPQDLAAVLREVPGELDPEAVERLVLRSLADKLARDPSQADHIARSLYDLAMAEGIANPELRAKAFWFWDALDLATDGLLDKSREEVMDELQDTLRRASEWPTSGS